MASISILKRKHGNVYRAQVYVNGARKTAVFDRKSDAVRWAEDIEYLLRNDLPLPGELPDNDMTIDAALDKYLHCISKKKATNTYRLERQAVNRISSFFTGKTLLTITSIDIAEYRDYRLSKVGTSTVLQDMSLLSKMYRIAKIEWGIKTDNPLNDVRRPSKPKQRMRILSVIEINSLLDAAKESLNEKLYPYILLQLHTAMRPSEGAGLTWKQVKWDDEIIDLTHTKTDPRRVPLTPESIDLLKELKEKSDPDNQNIFLPNDGKKRAIPSQFFKRSFTKAVQLAGIDNFTQYEMRHTAASWLLMCGVDIRVIADIMGHKNIAMTMKYTHLLDKHKLDAIKKIRWIGKK